MFRILKMRKISALIGVGSIPNPGFIFFSATIETTRLNKSSYWKCTIHLALLLGWVGPVGDIEGTLATISRLAHVAIGSQLVTETNAPTSQIRFEQLDKDRVSRCNVHARVPVDIILSTAIGVYKTDRFIVHVTPSLDVILRDQKFLVGEKCWRQEFWFAIRAMDLAYVLSVADESSGRRKDEAEETRFCIDADNVGGVCVGGADQRENCEEREGREERDGHDVTVEKYLCYFLFFFGGREGRWRIFM